MIPSYVSHVYIYIFKYIPVKSSSSPQWNKCYLTHFRMRKRKITSEITAYLSQKTRVRWRISHWLELGSEILFMFVCCLDGTKPDDWGAMHVAVDGHGILRPRSEQETRPKVQERHCQMCHRSGQPQRQSMASDQALKFIRNLIQKKTKTESFNGAMHRFILM